MIQLLGEESRKSDCQRPEVVDLGGLYAYSDGVVGLVRDNTGLFQNRRKQFGQAGTFTIRGQGDANPYIYDP